MFLHHSKKPTFLKAAIFLKEAIILKVDMFLHHNKAFKVVFHSLS